MGGAGDLRDVSTGQPLNRVESSSKLDRLGSKQEKTFRSVFAAALYGTLSITNVFLNKAIFRVHKFQMPATLVTGQTVFSLILLLLFKRLKLLKVQDFDARVLYKVSARVPTVPETYRHHMLKGFVMADSGWTTFHMLPDENCIRYASSCTNKHPHVWVSESNIKQSIHATYSVHLLQFCMAIGSY